MKYIKGHKLTHEEITKKIEKIFDLTPRGFIEKFNLLDGDIYRKLPKTLFMDNYPWEKTDMVKTIKKEFGVK